MDASKAVQALTTGDFVALVEALDTDRSAVFTMEDAEFLSMFRIGAVLLKRDVDPHLDGRHAELTLHRYEGVTEADESFNATIERTQRGRGVALAGNGPVGQLMVDGILTPAPELSISDMLNAVAEHLGQYVGAHRVAEAPVTVPDHVPDGWDRTI